MTTTFRVLIADKIAPEGLTPLSDDPRFELITRPGLPLAELTEALTDVDAVIGRAGVGVDTIDVPGARTTTCSRLRPLVG